MVERQIDRIDHEDSDHEYLAAYNEQQYVGFWNEPDTTIKLKLKTVDEDLTAGLFYTREGLQFDSDLVNPVQIQNVSVALDVRGGDHEAPGILTIDRPLTTIEDVSIRKVVPGGGG